MWVGIATSRASGAAREGASGANFNFITVGAEASGVCSSPSVTVTETLDVTFSDSWGGSWEMVAVGAGWHF